MLRHTGPAYDGNSPVGLQLTALVSVEQFVELRAVAERTPRSRLRRFHARGRSLGLLLNLGLGLGLSLGVFSLLAGNADAVNGEVPLALGAEGLGERRHQATATTR
jgi:hypothetical protein